MQPKRIIFIGTSSVFGRVDPIGGGFAGRFKKWFESQDIRNAVFNLGISGDTTVGMLKRLESEASIRRPDLIIIQLGLNDTKRVDSKNNPTLTSFEQFQSNVKKIIEKGNELANVIFLSVYPINDKKTTPMKGKNVFYLMSDAEKYSKAAKQICKENNILYNLYMVCKRFSLYQKVYKRIVLASLILLI